MSFKVLNELSLILTESSISFSSHKDQFRMCRSELGHVQLLSSYKQNLLFLDNQFIVKLFNTIKHFIISHFFFNTILIKKFVKIPAKSLNK